LISLTLFCSACSAPQEPIAEKGPTLEEQEDAENAIEPTREAVYIHDQNKPTQDNIIILNTGGEPVQLGAGYIRLLGTACSRNSRFALIEISGQGMTVVAGDKVNQTYQVSYIKEREVKLCTRE